MGAETKRKGEGGFKEHLLPPLAGAGAGAAGGAALGAAGGYGAASLDEAILRSRYGGSDRAAVEKVIKSLPSKIRPILMGALLVGGPAAVAGLITGMGRGEGSDPYASRTAGGIAGGLGGAGLGYLLRTKGSPLSSIAKGVATTALGAGAGAMTGLGVGSARYSQAQKRLRRLLEEAAAERGQLTGA